MSTHLSMQAFFQRITPHEAQQQTNKTLLQLGAQHAIEAAERQRLAQLKPGYGRPKLERTVNEALAAAAAAAAATATPDADTQDQSEASAHKRKKYNNWFASPYIHDIIAAYHSCGHSARRTVEHLQRSFPRLPTETEARFHSLAHNTVAGWFGPDHKLLPQFQAVLNQGRDAARRGPGFARLLDAHPDEEAEIKRVLGKMRSDAGAVINVRIVRWVMRAVLERKDASILTQLTLSHGFVSEWARAQMGWTWRCRTGTASKLPEDWHAQGSKMAQRIAANMEMYEVSRTQTHGSQYGIRLPAFCCVPPSMLTAFYSILWFVCLFRSIPPSWSTWIRLACILSPWTTTRTKRAPART